MKDFPRMTLEEEFRFFVEDALHGTDLTESDLLHYYCNEILGIAYCEENEEELMNAVIEDEPFILNQVADEMLASQA